ncbi:unnamed protein product, partial [Staurois parvus]
HKQAALYCNTKQLMFSLVKHTAHLVKQHTVNPLISPDVNYPFLLSVSQCFFISH